MLQKKIKELNTVHFDDQEQQPNPTLIDTVGHASDNKSALDKSAVDDADKSATSGKTVVFTAYGEFETSFEKDWYPSIFFHDLDKNDSTWQIHGAEIFVSVQREETHSLETKQREVSVTILTNEIWSHYDKDQYDEKVKEASNEFSRHKENDNYMIKIKYGKPADKETIMINSDRTKLNFETNSKLDITKNAKVVEVYSHNTDRLTLLY